MGHCLASAPLYNSCGVLSKYWNNAGHNQPSISQTSSSPALLYSDAPYDFLTTAVLASNLFATNVSLTLPTSVVTNLPQLLLAPWDYNLVSFGADLALLNAAYPPGNYTFDVQEASSSLSGTVNFPSTLVQPAAPHISNFQATQAVDPASPFTPSGKFKIVRGGTTDTLV